MSAQQEGYTRLEHLCRLDLLRAELAPKRLTGIICTIGPACEDSKTIEKMLEAGMNIARLNFSHGTHEYHAKILKNLQIAVENYSEKIGRQYPLGIAMDTQGPEIRTGVLEGGYTSEILLKRGDRLKVTGEHVHALKTNASLIYITYDIHKCVYPGLRIHIDHGEITLICLKVKGGFINCVVENGGYLGSRKSVNLLGIDLDLVDVTEDDKLDMKFAIDNDIDIIFASYVRSAFAVSEIRNVLGEKGKEIVIISKIETLSGFEHLKEILQVSDGIIIVRNSLGVEIPTDKTFLAQKSIISICNLNGKPIICATQMLDSMIKNAEPTRADVSDVANAVIDGADCVLLSSETAVGKYPAKSVLKMSNTCKEAESALWHEEIFQDLLSKVSPPIEVAHSIAIAAVQASLHNLAKSIIVITTTGLMSRLISKYKPKCPIISITREARIARQSHLFRGILSIYYEKKIVENWLDDVDVYFEFAINYGKTQGFIKPGDYVIGVTKWKREMGFSDTLRILRASGMETLLY